MLALSMDQLSRKNTLDGDWWDFMARDPAWHSVGLLSF